MNTNHLPAEIKTAVQQSGIQDLTKAEAIASSYAPFMAQVTEQMDKLKPLKKGNAEDVEKAKRIRIDLGKIASAADKQKAVDKASLLLETRFIDALFNTVNGAARITQGEAKEIEEHFERMEAERKAKLQSEREIEVAPYLMEGQPHGDYSAMTDDVYANYLVGVKLAHEARVKAQKEAEEAARIERELNERESSRRFHMAALSDFIKGEHDIRNMSEQEFDAFIDCVRAEKKAVEEQQEEIRLENERLRKEREESEKKAAKEREAQEAALKAERLERERIEAELARQKAEQEAKERAEAQRIEAEKKAAEKAAKEAAKAPDRDKIKAAIQSMQMPEITCKEQDMRALYSVICQKFDAFKAWAESQLNNQ